MLCDMRCCAMLCHLVCCSFMSPRNYTVARLHCVPSKADALAYLQASKRVKLHPHLAAKFFLERNAAGLLYVSFGLTIAALIGQSPMMVDNCRRHDTLRPPKDGRLYNPSNLEIWKLFALLWPVPTKAVPSKTDAYIFSLYTKPSLPKLFPLKRKPIDFHFAQNRPHHKCLT